MSFVNGPGGGGFRLNLPKRAVDPQVSTQVMPGAAPQEDPLNKFLNEGAQESPEQLSERYGSLFDGTDFGFKKAGGLGIDPSVSAALNKRMQHNFTNMVGRERGALMRQVPQDFAQRQSVYQGLADANVRRVMGIEAQAEAARQAAKQKRGALTSSLLGLAGAAGGAMLMPANPMAGAMIGSGVGSTVGSQL